jgi:hypothetical protein
MSVDDRLRTGLREAAATPVVDTTAALVEVENMDQKVKTRRGVLLAVAAAAVVIAGLVWGPGLLDSLGGETDPVPAGPPDGPAAVLAEYQEARNAGDVDALMSLYATTAVVNEHPLDEGRFPVAFGVDEIRLLEAQVPGIQRAENATEYSAIEVSGNRATFTQRFIDDAGSCSSSAGNEIVVQDGKITQYTWGDESADVCP